MQADFNPFTAQRREHEEMMMVMMVMGMSILKNICYHRRLQKRKRFKAPTL